MHQAGTIETEVPEDRRSACRNFGYAARQRMKLNADIGISTKPSRFIGLKPDSHSGFHSEWGWKILP